jgi:hypothetical protein
VGKAGAVILMRPKHENGASEEEAGGNQNNASTAKVQHATHVGINTY